MPSIMMEVKGYNRVRNSFRKLISMKSSYFRPTLDEWGRDSARILRQIPYPPPNSTYVRTYQMQRGFRHEMLGEAQVGFYNQAMSPNGYPYPEIVVVEGQQAWFHLRWWTIQQVIETQIPLLRESLYNRIRRDWVGG